jgi:hypothetical protein
LRFLFAAKVFQRRFLREWIQARHVTPTLALIGAHSSQQAEGFRQAEIPKIAPSVVVAAACDDLEDFVDIRCAICMSFLFESKGDGSIKIDDREMSFPGEHTCARAILELRERFYRKPTAHMVKCHIFGVAVMHDLLKISGFQG